MPHLISYRIILSLAILGFGLMSYANSFNGPFVFDDIGYILSNTKIRDLSRLDDIWHALPEPSRVVGMFTFALNYHVHKYDVFGYHVVNFSIHLINAFLVFWLVRCLFQTRKLRNIFSDREEWQITALTALFFVVHPMQTQAVTYIAQRFASLATLFYLLSVCCYISGRITDRRGVVWYVASAVSAMLGMATKQIVMTLPIMILLIEFLFIYSKPVSIKRFKDLPWRLIVPISLFLLIVPAFYGFDVAARFYEEGNWQNRSHRGDLISTRIYFLTQFCVVATYLRLWILPIGQNLLYDFRSSYSLFEPKTLACFIFIMGLIGAGVYFIRQKRTRLLGFGIFWFFITLLIESSIIMIKHVIFEHRCYLPSFGFCLFAATGLTLLVRDFRKWLAVSLVFIGTLSYLTYQRNAVWSDDVRLWTDGIMKSPDKARPYMNLGLAYLTRGQYTEAAAYSTQAIENNQHNYAAYSNRGTAHFFLGFYDEALADFNKALEINEDYTQAYINRGNYHGKMKNYDLAIMDYNKALELDPNSEEAYHNRGNKYARLKQFDKALDDYNKALDISPKFIQAYKSLGNAYEKMGRYDEAIASYNKAILFANEPTAAHYYQRGNAYGGKKEWEKALADYNQALRLQPGYMHAHAKRSKVYVQLKRYADAVQDLRLMQQAGIRVSSQYIRTLEKKALKNLP